MIFCSKHIMLDNHGICPAGLQPRHPSQLYEAGLEGILMLIIMQLGIRVLRWHEKPGFSSGVFLIGYGLVRIVSELFREPDAPFIGPVTMGETLSAAFIIGGAVVIWLARRSPTARTA